MGVGARGITAHPHPAGISHGPAEVAGPVIAALSWRGPYGGGAGGCAPRAYRIATPDQAPCAGPASTDRGCSRPSGAEDDPSRACGPRPERGRQRAGGGLSRRIHLWAWAGRGGRATQRHGMCRARVSPARRRAHRAPSGHRALSALWGPAAPDRHAARSRRHPEDPRAPGDRPLRAEPRPRPTRARHGRALIRSRRGGRRRACAARRYQR